MHELSDLYIYKEYLNFSISRPDGRLQLYISTLKIKRNVMLF